MPDLLKSLEQDHVVSNYMSVVIDPNPDISNNYDFFTLADIENMFEDDLSNIINIDGNYFPSTSKNNNNSPSTNNVNVTVVEKEV